MTKNPHCVGSLKLSSGPPALQIDPFDPKRVGPNSYNLRLHHELGVYEADVLDMKTPQTLRRLTIVEQAPQK